ncbi:phage tail protein, partial [Bradyrhizobium ottawaense]
VSNSKLATGSVTSNKIADQNVTYGKLDPTMGALLANLVLPAGLGPIPWSVPALPVGWDWADGGVLLSNTSYPALRQRYIDAGYPHGQDGSGNPKKPDMRGRVPIGWDTMAGSPANRITTAGCGIDG